MKNFFKIVFATFFSLVLFCVLVALLAVGLVAGLIKLGAKQEPKIEKGSYLVVDMSINIADTPPPSENSQALGRLLGGGDDHTVSLRGVLRAIDTAAKDPLIAGIFLHGSFEPSGYGSGYAALKEMREALANFQATSHKPIVAYLVGPSMRDYYLTSVADTIYLNPFGEMQLQGLATEPTFFGDAFKKYGIEVQVTRVGKYKSFVEPYIRNNMSPESREQTQTLLDDLWTEIKGGVAQGRKLTPDQVQAHHGQGRPRQRRRRQGGRPGQRTRLPARRDRKTAQDRGQRPARPTIEIPSSRLTWPPTSGRTSATPTAADSKLAALMDNTPKIAIVYAEGDIVDGDAEATGYIGGDRFARELRRLREDPAA